MIEISEELRIARPAQEVWATLADFGGISRWAPNVDHSCLTTYQIDGLGAVRRIQSGRNTLLETIIAWEPDERLSYFIDGLPPVVRSVRNTWTLEAVGGATKVTLASVIDAGPRPPQQLIAKGVGRALAKASRQMLQGLDSHLGQTKLERTPQ